MRADSSKLSFPDCQPVVGSSNVFFKGGHRTIWTPCSTSPPPKLYRAALCFSFPIYFIVVKIFWVFGPPGTLKEASNN